MKAYEFRGTFTFAVDAESRESAERMLIEQLGEVLLDWRIESVSSD